MSRYDIRGWSYGIGSFDDRNEFDDVMFTLQIPRRRI